MDKFKDLEKRIIDFRNARNWGQFHKPKDLALSLSLEASELMEHFQWKTDEECRQHIENHKEDIADEMADVLNYLLTMAHDFNIDLYEATKNKLEKTDKKYPVEKSRGNHKKYTEL